MSSLLDMKSNLRERKKRMKRRLIGLLLLVIAIVVGIYVGGWLCFLEAILNIIEAVKIGVVMKDIVLVICKIFIFLPMAMFCTCILSVAGYAMLLDK